MYVINQQTMSIFVNIKILVFRLPSLTGARTDSHCDVEINLFGDSSHMRIKSLKTPFTF